jgi:hypothetical protein
VIARSNDTSLLDSEQSNTVFLTIQKLEAPTIIIGDDSIISWNKIQNASRYEIFIGDKSINITPTIESQKAHSINPAVPYVYGTYASGDATSYDVSSWASSLETEGDQKDFYVIAETESEKSEFIDSDKSNVVTKYLSVYATYKAIIGNAKAAYDIELPFSIT